MAPAKSTTAEPVEAGRIEHVDPSTLTIAANVRTDTKVDPEFIESIRQVGVLQPPMVTANESGSYDVVLGQRRTLGAVAAGLKSMPIYVVGKHEADAARVIDQLTENEQRQSLTDAERLGGYRALSLFGMKPSDIVKRAARPAGEVERYLKVVKSDLASATFTDRQITLEDAVALAELDNHPDVQAELASKAGKGGFGWELQRARRLIEAKADGEKTRAKLTKAGVTIVDERPAQYWILEIDKLADPTDPYTSFDETTHAKCPGHVAYIGTGEYEHGAATFMCLDPDGNGHIRKAWGAAPTEEERLEQEAKKAAADELQANLDIATASRLEFLHSKLTDKTPPAGYASIFVTAFLTLDDIDIESSSSQVYTLLGIDRNNVDDTDLAQTLLKNNKLATIYPTAVALAGLENCTWVLDPTSGRGWGKDAVGNATVAYFQILTDWGYTLSDFELERLSALEQPDTEPSEEDVAPDMGNADDIEDQD